jgi:hypothetical protein
MIVRLQIYGAVLKCKPGKEMLLGDTLSRAPISESRSKPLTFDSVNNIMAEDKGRTDRIQELFEEDEKMKQPADQISYRWPEDKGKMAGVVRPYFKVRD